MAEVVRTETDLGHRYRITRTDRGFLVSSSMRNETGLLLGPAEWLYRTEESAQRALDFIVLTNAYFSAFTNGYPVGDLAERSERAAAHLREVTERLDDKPLIGREVRALRQPDDGEW